MKTRVSIILVALCGVLFVLTAPQKHFYGWALGQIFDGNFQTYWKNGVVQLEQPHFKWPEKDFKKSWKTTLAVGIIERFPVAIRNGSLDYQGVALKINGLYSPTSSNLTISHNDEKIFHMQKEGNKAAEFSFSNTPIAFLQPFFPLKDFSGLIVEGKMDEHLKGSLVVNEMNYKENNFNLHIPHATLAFNGKDVQVLGSNVSLSYDEKPLWTLDPLPMKLTINQGVHFDIQSNGPIHFTDQRFKVESQLENVKAVGSLTPAKVETLSFAKSLLSPIDDSSTISMNHSVSCDYKKGRASFFTILGKEISFEMNLDKEKTFLAEFSEHFLEKFGLETLPIRKVVGKVNKNQSLWNIDAQVENGTLQASLPSLLMPQAQVKEIKLALNDFYLLKDVKVNFTPKQDDPYYFEWQGGFKDLSLKGTGTKDEYFSFTVAGGGAIESWKELINIIDPNNRLSLIPIEGNCIVTEGIIDKDVIKVNAHVSNGTLTDLKNISGKLIYNSSFDLVELTDVTGHYKYHDKDLLVFLPKITYDDQITFDGWVADQSQDFMRLAGVASMSDNALVHIKFDRTKTHLLNIIPDHFTLTLKDWSQIQKMDFQGQGPFKTPLFDDLNRWTLNDDWNISFHYNTLASNNTFDIQKGQLSLNGAIDDLTHLTIKNLKLDIPSVSLAAMGTVDLKEFIVRLDPLDVVVNFEESPLLTHIPIQGSFKAQGIATANLQSSESHLEVQPNNLTFGMLSVANAPFELHQRGDDFTFNCAYLFNDSPLQSFDCLLNKQGLKAQNGILSFFVGSTHFGIDKAGFCLRGRHTPNLCLVDPIDTQVEIVKSLMPFPLHQIQGGTLAIDNGHCTIRDTVVFGKEVDKINFDFELTDDLQLALKNIAMNNEEENVLINQATLTFADNHLQKIEFPELKGKNINMSPLVVTKIGLENFASVWPFSNFSGEGNVSFTNLLPILAKTINQEDMHELASIDAKWFLPNQGEFNFAASDEHLRLNDLNCFSSGKMIRFELQNEESILDWNGAISLPLKLKPQHLSFKWSELFSLNLQGTVESPLLQFKRK